MIDRLEREVELLDRHVAVLRQVTDSQPIGITTLSTQLECPEHKVRYSLRKLEHSELVEPTKSGAVTTDRADAVLSDLTRDLVDVAGRLDRLRTEFKQAAR